MTVRVEGARLKALKGRRQLGGGGECHENPLGEASWAEPLGARKVGTLATCLEKEMGWTFGNQQRETAAKSLGAPTQL
jgi:hypothetical protein